MGVNGVNGVSGQNSSNTRSRASSTASNEGGTGFNVGDFRVEGFTEVNKRPASIPRVEIKDFDEDSGYHGDKESIESKKGV